MQERDHIVVFVQFDSGIDASIAKAKLDAYGVPCFLTGEHMSWLYQRALGMKVRLHIFEKDREEATRVMFEPQTLESAESTCPRCHGSTVERDFPKKLSEEFAGALWVTFFGVFMPEKKIFRCQQCDHEF